MKATVNPVTARELRERFRRPRSAVFFSVWLMVIIGIGYLIYLLARATVRNEGIFGEGLLGSPAIGQFMFEALLVLLMTAVILVVPGVAATSIVGERDRQTLHLLQVSQLTPGQIVFGKLWSSLAYLLLMLLAVAPVLVVPALFGGVTFRDAAVGLGAIGVTAIAVGALTVAVSARARTTRGAVAGAYLLTFALTVGSFLLIFGELVLIDAQPGRTFGTDGREVYSAWINPYVGMVSALAEPVRQADLGLFGSPFDPIAELLNRRAFGDEGFFAFEPLAARAAEPGGRSAIWPRSLVVYAAITAASLVLAARALRVPARKRQRRRSRAPA